MTNEADVTPPVVVGGHLGSIVPPHRRGEERPDSAGTRGDGLETKQVL